MNYNTIFIVGSSKSGVYFLTDYLNNSISSIDIKHLENSLFFKEINEKNIHSKWINIIENPFNVLYSMFYYDENEFYHNEDQHLCYCFYKWNYLDSVNSFNNIFTVSFENLDIEKLSNYLDFSFSIKKYEDMFENIPVFYENNKMQYLKKILKKRSLYNFVSEKVYCWYKLQKLVKFI